jgi:DNA-binding transcriptional regulator YiaG
MQIDFSKPAEKYASGVRLIFAIMPYHSAERRTEMSRREITRTRWAKEDPEFLRLIQEEKERLEVGRKIADIRTNTGLSRSQFAAFLGISIEEVRLLEGGDLWKSEEATFIWINESLDL